ncbi:hypothetical protein [Paenisporosarcina sp. TG20]|nr:hypothetical protein [Paenisporosarcina sp. TG20]
MATITEKRPKAFAKMKNILKKEMKDQGLTVEDVKKTLTNKKNEK